MANRAVISDRMFPDRCDIYPGAAIPARAERDGSGGRPGDVSTPIATDVQCTIQPAGAIALTKAAALAVQVTISVYFNGDPGDLRTGARIVPTKIRGVPVARRQGLSVQFVDIDDLPPLVIWVAHCFGRD
jgi:hypothetical protein